VTLDRFEAFCLLVFKGANPMARNISGASALSLVLKRGWIEWADKSIHGLSDKEILSAVQESHRNGN
jgi:hypothetical protein